MTHTHQSHAALIWKVFFVLSVITIVEVALGIVRPDFLVHTRVGGTSILNWIFLILTLFKAYGIAWYFMHLKDEVTWFRRAIVWPVVFLIVYLAYFLLYDGNSLHIIDQNLIKWHY